MTAARAPVKVPTNGAVGADSSSARLGQSGLVDVAAHELAGIRGRLRSRPVLGRCPASASRAPGVAREMWALFAVYQAICQLTGAGVDAAGAPGERIGFPHALAAATSTVTAFPLTGSTSRSLLSC
jgi:hypothetical protein